MAKFGAFDNQPSGFAEGGSMGLPKFELGTDKGGDDYASKIDRMAKQCQAAASGSGLSIAPLKGTRGLALRDALLTPADRSLAEIRRLIEAREYQKALAAIARLRAESP